MFALHKQTIFNDLFKFIIGISFTLYLFIYCISFLNSKIELGQDLMKHTASCSPENAHYFCNTSTLPNSNTNIHFDLPNQDEQRDDNDDDFENNYAKPKNVFLNPLKLELRDNTIVSVKIHKTLPLYILYHRLKIFKI